MKPKKPSSFGENKFKNHRLSSFNSGPREMHKAKCSDCKKDCEVPFKPSTDRPVYCKDCFSNHKKY